MSRIEPARGNLKLMWADVPAPVGLARLKLWMLAKEAWYYDVSFMYVTNGS